MARLMQVALAMAAVSMPAHGLQAHRAEGGQPHGHILLEDTTSFEEYAAAFSRNYTTLNDDHPEYQMRRSLFDRRAEEVQKHNENPDRRWSAALNAHSDRTEEELARLHGWNRRAGRPAPSRPSPSLLHSGRAAESNLPEKVEWNDLYITTHIPDQGDCGSCWAVTSTSVLQARYEIFQGGSKTFSLQEIVSCVPNEKQCGGSGGCDGATVELAMAYVERHGLHEDSELPYHAETGECPASFLSLGQARSQRQIQRDDNDDDNEGPARKQFGFTGWSKLPENKARPLMEAVVEGPVAISVAADLWHNYGTGVLDACSKDALVSHAVLLTGYGRDGGIRGGTNFWAIQNSWGKHWGENGSIRLYRGDTIAEDDAYCGEDNQPELGTACEPYPNSVHVCGMCGILYDSVVPHFAQAKKSANFHYIPDTTLSYESAF